MTERCIYCQGILKVHAKAISHWTYKCLDCGKMQHALEKIPESELGPNKQGQQVLE